MSFCRQNWMVLAFIGLCGPAFAKTGLHGTLGHQSVFFTDQLRMRHHRYYLDLKQNTELLPYKLSTVLEGRFITDQATSDDERAPDWSFSDQVHDDEYFESYTRQAYLDYVTDSTQTRIGLQQIDWIDSLAQNVSNILTPLDMRFGGFGASNELILPVGALNFSHKLFSGSLDWLFVSHPRHHRLAKGDNGYGYYETLSSLVGDAPFAVEDQEPKTSMHNSEQGLRYTLNFSGFNLAMIGYRGHNRSPILRARALTPQSFIIKETYPVVNTYVVSGSTSDDSLVVRLLLLHQPNRSVSYSIGLPSSQNIPPEAKQKHSRFVGGVDYAFSKHFKFYSESVLSRTETTPSDFFTTNNRSDPHKDETAFSIKLTNETFDDTVFSVDTTLTGPDKSSAITGQGEWTIGGNYRLNIGARRINAKTKDAAFYPIRNTNQYFLTLERSFNEKSFQ